MAMPGLFAAGLPPGARIGQLFTSPVRRCLQTTVPLARSLGLQPTVWPDFFEVGGMYDQAADDSGGQLGGLTQAEIEREFGGYDASLVGTGIAGGWWRGGRESEEDAERRIRGIVQRFRSMAAEPAPGPAAGARVIAAVGHGDLIRLIMQEVTGAGKDVSFGSFNTSITCLDFRSDGVVQVRYSNYGAPEVFHTQDVTT